MMRSLFSGVSGLRVHQTKMDVIGNNISNVNTVGYKRATTTFSDAISQTLSGATAASDTTGRGGVNAKQIGLGANVSAISNIMTTGSSERTDNPNDVMISGDGFFIVSDSTGYYFTRAGAFQVDDAGNLTDSNGMAVCGWTTDEDGNVIQSKVSGLNLYEGTKSYLKPQVTDSVTFSGNINAATNPNQVNTVAFYDSLGNRYVVNANMIYDEDSQSWNVTIDPTAQINGDSTSTTQLNFGTSTINLKFDEDGTLLAQDPDSLKIVTTVDFAGDNPYNSVFADEITIDFSGLTQFQAKADAKATTDNGYEAGTLKGYSIGTDGTITGTYTNGLAKTLGQIAVADFPNPSGLEKIGNNLYAATTNSGDFDGIGVEVGANGGSLAGGVLEMSNVDISYEFTQMITTQRGFQANSRIITTSDEMLQELVNLKR